VKKLIPCLVFVLAVGLLFSGCGKTEQPAPAPAPGAAPAPVELVVVPKVGIGELKFGMTLKEVSDLWGPPDLTKNPGYILDYYGWRGVSLGFPYEKLMIINCLNELAGDDVVSFDGTTPEGIRLGSTEDEVIAAYGEPTSIKTGTTNAWLTYDPIAARFDLRPDDQGRNTVYSMIFSQRHEPPPSDVPSEEEQEDDI
jgi:hypothetical protein